MKIENEGFAIFNGVVLITAKLRILEARFTCLLEKILMLGRSLLGVFGEISHDKHKMDVSPRLQSRLVTVFVVRGEFGG